MESAHGFRRPVFDELLRRASGPRGFIQALVGPRQTGKTTLARQVLDAVPWAGHYASADDPGGRGRGWLDAQWDIGRLRAREAPGEGAVLILDEVHAIAGWADIVKRLWDEDTAAGVPLRVIVLGSSALNVRQALAASLAGRFELSRVTHWAYPEMREAFGWDLDRYLFFGGYPGAAALADDVDRWRSYVLDSLAESALARDVLLLARVEKPALLRQLFRLACDYSGQVLSYNKMLGQLTDAGNTTTLAHYLELLAGAGMVAGLEKFSGSRVRQRGSSPKLIALNTALVSATAGTRLPGARTDTAAWGRLVETAVGAHLVASAQDRIEVSYWRERNLEVDFVLRSGADVAGIEVTAGTKRSTAGLAAFRSEHPGARTLLIGPSGIPLEECLSSPASRWLG